MFADLFPDLQQQLDKLSIYKPMPIPQRALDTIGDLLEVQSEKIREEHKDKPEWFAQEIINELWDAHELLYDNVE